MLDPVRGNTEKEERGQFNIENGAKEQNEGERHEGARSRVAKGGCKGKKGIKKRPFD